MSMAGGAAERYRRLARRMDKEARMTKTFDYVVVGGGSAGCVVAARLAEDPDVTVCLVEGGPAHEDDPAVLGFLGGTSLSGPAYDYDYPIAPQPHRTAELRMIRGRMLGGSSSINDAVAWRALDRDLRRWVELGAEGWGPQDTRAAFDRVFEKLGIIDVERRSGVAQAVHAAALALGVPEVVTNGEDFDTGAAWYQLNAAGGIRRSAAVGYLYPLAELPSNLTLLTQRRAERVLIEDRRAVGVLVDGERIEAREEVVVCAGAIDSPKLLLLSGVGASDHLREVGVDLVLDLPGVGRRLQDHCEASIIWELTQPVGPSMQNGENGIFLSTGLQGPAFDLYYHVLTQFYHVDPARLGFPDALPDNALTLAPNTAKPLSEGTICLVSADPDVAPIIDPGYLSDRDGVDLQVLVEGVRFARQLAAEPALAPWIARELAPGESVRTDEEIAEWVRALHTSTYHPVASCRMGSAADDEAVVDPQLRVRGIDRLRVADASVFPAMLSNNIGMAVMMIGERCAELIKAGS